MRFSVLKLVINYLNLFRNRLVKFDSIFLYRRYLHRKLQYFFNKKLKYFLRKTLRQNPKIRSQRIFETELLIPILKTASFCLQSEKVIEMLNVT